MLPKFKGINVKFATAKLGKHFYLVLAVSDLGKTFGRSIDGKVITHYIVFAGCVLLFLFLLRLVNSPFGRVLCCT